MKSAAVDHRVNEGGKILHIYVVLTYVTFRVNHFYPQYLLFYKGSFVSPNQRFTSVTSSQWTSHGGSELRRVSSWSLLTEITKHLTRNVGFVLIAETNSL